jgi:hypothetical protein
MISTLSFGRCSLSVIAFCLLGACASSHSMGEREHAQLAAIRVGKDVKLAPTMTFSPNALALTGTPDGARLFSSRQDASEQFAAYARQHRVDIARIVREETIAGLRASGKLAIVDGDGPANATLHVELKEYGFTGASAGGALLEPNIALRLELDDATGAALWTDDAHVRPPQGAVALDDLITDPHQIDLQWRAAVRADVEALAMGLPVPTAAQQQLIERQRNATLGDDRLEVARLKAADTPLAPLARLEEAADAPVMVAEVPAPASLQVTKAEHAVQPVPSSPAVARAEQRQSAVAVPSAPVVSAVPIQARVAMEPLAQHVLGAWSYEVDRMAREQSCFGEAAWLINGDGTVEHYRVECGDGRVMSAACNGQICQLTP